MPETTAATPKMSYDEQMRLHQEEIRDARRYGFVLVGVYTEGSEASRCCDPVAVDESEEGIIMVRNTTLWHKGANRQVEDTPGLETYPEPKRQLQGEAA